MNSASRWIWPKLLDEPYCLAVANSAGCSCSTEENLIHLKGGGRGWGRCMMGMLGKVCRNLLIVAEAIYLSFRFVRFRAIKNTEFSEMVDISSDVGVGWVWKK